MTAITVFLTFLLLLIMLVIGLVAAYLLHKRLKFLELENGRLQVTAIRDTHQLEKQIQHLIARIDTLEHRATESRQHPGLSVNYSQRSQILRMIRRGDSPEQIANASRIPHSQIKLLMKLPGSTPSNGKDTRLTKGQ